VPLQGFLQHLNRQEEVPCNITQGTNFTQDDLDQGFICYIHTGLHGVRDLIKFDVTDGINAPIDRYFYITIGSIDRVFPEVINEGVTLKEGGKVTQLMCSARVMLTVLMKVCISVSPGTQPGAI